MINLSLWKINTATQRKALKFHTCELCGCDIIPGDLYYSYKPLPIYDTSTNSFRAQSWQCRCLNHRPRFYQTEQIQLFSEVNYGRI